MKKIRSILRIEQGFTLIELLAVMAILAVLVGVVAPSVIGSKDASVRAQALQDALQVRSAASKSFSAINEGELRTPHTITTTTLLDTATPGVVTSAQEKSSKWPEKYITTGSEANFSAIYADVFQTSVSTNNGKVKTIILKDKSGTEFTDAAYTAFLVNHTAIDLAKMVTDKHLEAQPAGVAATSVTVGSHTVPTYLWLFEKKSSDPNRTNDSRDVVVYQLVKVSRNEAATRTNDAASVDLTYQRIF